MADFEVPSDLSFNRGRIADPEAFALRPCRCVMAVPVWRGVRRDGRRHVVCPGAGGSSGVREHHLRSAAFFDIDLARQHLAALDRLPRPTLVTCRTGPRSSAIVYLYAGLQAGASADEVLALADADAAPFVGSDELRAVVVQGLEELGPDA